MKALSAAAWALAMMVVAAPALAQITFYEREGFGGRTFTTEQPIDDFQNVPGLNDRARSVIVRGERWEVCDNARFSGRCVVLRPGQYPTLTALGLSERISSARDVDNPAMPVAATQITFFEREGFGGLSFSTEQPIDDFQNVPGLDDRARSIVVTGGRWEVCDGARFNGHCVVLPPGRYPSLGTMGLSERISSARYLGRNARSDEPRYPAAAVATPDYRRRGNEPLYEVNVTSVRAVFGTPERRCWVEREQLAQEPGGNNVAGALVGAVLGGILGHQVGSGTGKEVATAGGAIAGAVIGSNVGRDAQQPPGLDAQHCERVPGQAQPQYWDVTYHFRGQQHRMQMTSPPGRTVVVNEQGEPRR